MVIGIKEQPLLGASGIGEGEDTAASSRVTHGRVGGPAFGITWVVGREPSAGFIPWNTILSSRLDQLTSNRSVTVQTIAAWDRSSSDTISSTRRNESASTAEARALLGGALLQPTASFNLLSRAADGGSLLGGSHREEGKDKEDLLDRVHFQCVCKSFKVKVLEICDSR